MFTGLVTHIGTITSLRQNGDGQEIQISSPGMEPVLGESVAVNGCCLTATKPQGTQWSADMVPETMSRTSYSTLKVGDRVNLERALEVGARLGGHFVQGHVDGTGRLDSQEPMSDGSQLVTITAAPDVLKYLVEKGSITVDGVSLTVVSVSPLGFQFAMIPHTTEHTALGTKAHGDLVNLEVDILAKYVERLTNGLSAQLIDN
jgi:riboflavin synthase